MTEIAEERVFAVGMAEIVWQFEMSATELTTAPTVPTKGSAKIGVVSATEETNFGLSNAH